MPSGKFDGLSKLGMGLTQVWSYVGVDRWGQAALHCIIITWLLTVNVGVGRGHVALHGITITWSLTNKNTAGPGHANHVIKT